MFICSCLIVYNVYYLTIYRFLYKHGFSDIELETFPRPFLSDDLINSNRTNILLVVSYMKESVRQMRKMHHACKHHIDKISHLYKKRLICIQFLDQCLITDQDP